MFQGFITVNNDEYDIVFAPVEGKLNLPHKKELLSVAKDGRNDFDLQPDRFKYRSYNYKQGSRMNHYSRQVE